MSPKRNHSPAFLQRASLTARQRRRQESCLIQELATTLPVAHVTARSLNKLSVLRLAAMDLRVRRLFGNFSYNPGTENHTLALSLIHWEQELLGGGFLIILDASCSGEVMYVSGGVYESFRQSSCDVTGRSIYEYAHPADHKDIDQLLAPSPPGCAIPEARWGLIRLRLQPGTSTETQCYKTVQLSGKFYGTPSPCAPWPCFIGVGLRIPHSTDFGYPLPFLTTRAFTSVHSSKNLAFLHVDPVVEQILGFTESELSQLRAFDLLHPADMDMVVGCSSKMHEKGQAGGGGLFRLLAKGGGWVWMVAEGSVMETSTCSSQTRKNVEDSAVIFCRFFQISDVCERDKTLSLVQLPTSAVPSKQSAEVAETRPSEACRLIEELLCSGSSYDSDTDWSMYAEEFSQFLLPASE